MTRFVGYLKQNAIAIAALFIALGGTSYAAVAIPKNSVGSSQLRKGAVTSTKIRSGAITPGKLAGKSFGGRILYFAEIENNGAVAVSDPKGVKTDAWNANIRRAGSCFPRQSRTAASRLRSAASPCRQPSAAQAPSVGAGFSNSTRRRVRCQRPGAGDAGDHLRTLMAAPRLAPRRAVCSALCATFGVGSDGVPAFAAPARADELVYACGPQPNNVFYEADAFGMEEAETCGQAAGTMDHLTRVAALGWRRRLLGGADAPAGLLIDQASVGLHEHQCDQRAAVRTAADFSGDPAH